MPTDKHLVIRLADKNDVHVISTLAHATWPVTYENIVGKVQLEYMLGIFYSEMSLSRQMDEGQQFFIAELSSEPVGFAAVSQEYTIGVFKLHKLYVHPLVQGKGIGKELLIKIIQEAKNSNASVIRLNVNRQNPAKNFYERSGFVIVGQEDIAIGEGYFMNDYVMEKKYDHFNK
jgi:GNAT superfamily N-acetyltransferase